MVITGGQTEGLEPFGQLDLSPEAGMSCLGLGGPGGSAEPQESTIKRLVAPEILR